MRLLFQLSSMILLTACASPERVAQIAENDAAIFEKPCEAPSTQICTFFNSPVPLKPEPVKLFLRKNTFFPTAKPLEFVDSRGLKWIAPAATLTDGASIPQIFVPIIGFPNSPEFANAATVHDAYCGIGNEKGEKYHSSTWQKTHRMFYDALRSGGTSAIKAKIMFAAVYIGGPRWIGVKKSTTTPATRARLTQRRSHIDTTLLRLGISIKDLRLMFVEVRKYIQANNPTIQNLEFFIANLEPKYISRIRNSDTNTPSVPDYPDKFPIQETIK